MKSAIKTSYRIGNNTFDTVKELAAHLGMSYFNVHTRIRNKRPVNDEMIKIIKEIIDEQTEGSVGRIEA